MTQALTESLPGLEAPARPRTEESPAAAHRIVRNSTLNLTAQALYALFHLLVIFTLARSLGKDGFGLYYTFIALILAVQLVVEAGVGTVLTCRIAQAPEGWRDTVAEATGIFGVIAIASAALFAAAGGAWAWWNDDPAGWLHFLAAGLACAGIQVQRFAAGVLQAFEDFGPQNWAKIMQGALLAGLVVGIVLLGTAGVTAVLMLYAASQIFAALYLLASLQRRCHCLAWRFSLAGARNWLVEAVPLGLGDVARGLTWQLDTILLGILQPAIVVGIYSVAYRPLGPLNWLPRAVLTAAFPSFARMGERDLAGLDRASSASLRLMWIVSLPIAIAISACAEPIVLFLAGPEYLDAVLPMRILIWVTALSYLSFQYRFLFTALGRQRLYIVLVVGVLALEAALELWLIPQWGYLGACAGTMVGEAVFTVVGLVICRCLGVGRIDVRALAAATLAGAVMGLVLWPAEGLGVALLIVAVGLATVLYFALCVWLGALHWEEVQRFQHILARLCRTAASERPAKA